MSLRKILLWLALPILAGFSASSFATCSIAGYTAADMPALFTVVSNSYPGLYTIQSEGQITFIGPNFGVGTPSCTSSPCSSGTWSYTSNSCENPPPPTCQSQDLGIYYSKGPTGTYCDGQCKITLSFTVDINGPNTTECWGEGSDRVCSFSRWRLAESCSLNDLPSSSSPPANDVPPEAQCPDGFIKINNTVQCTQPGTGGTPTTSSGPGTPSQPAKVICAIGFVDNGAGCVSAGQPSTHGCPAGTTLNAANKCEDLTNLPSSSQGNSATPGNCGAPGQPACDTVVKSEPLTQSEQGLLTSIVNDHRNGTISWFGNIINQSLPQHGWTWAPAIESATCEVWELTAGGRTMSIDPCPTIDKIRTVAGYALYVFAAFSIFGMVFNSNKES